MRALTSFLALALAALVSADDSDVLTLTASSFESKVNAEPIVLVEFFAPWCGHCKALAPHYEEAATVLKDKNIKLAKVDCVDQADLCQAHGVQGYPTLKVFRNGTPTDYAGPRKADGIISYMIKQSLPALTTVTSSSFSEFKSADKIVALLYLSSPTEAPAAEFSATAEKHRDDFLFGVTTDSELIAAEGVTPPALVLYRTFDAPVSTYPYPIPSATVSDISAWIHELSIPTIDEVGSDNYAMYAQSGLPLAYLFIDPTSENKDADIETVRRVAEKYKGKVNFVWIDAIKFGDHAKALNLNAGKWPAFVVQDMVKQLKYPLNGAGEISTEAVGAWVDKFVKGELKPELKSQPIPEQTEDVFTLVGKEFEQQVFDDSKDVFVEFYASWCGHCKRLKPTWDSLGEHFKDVKDQVLIAKMEATENDLPPELPFRVSGFPTLKFKPAGTREFLDYEGDRSLESLVAYVQEHAKNSLTVKPSEVVEEGSQKPIQVDGNDTAHDEL